MANRRTCFTTRPSTAAQTKKTVDKYSVTLFIGFVLNIVLLFCPFSSDQTTNDLYLFIHLFGLLYGIINGKIIYRTEEQK